MQNCTIAKSEGNNMVDLVKMFGQGGCSAKLPAKELAKVLAKLPVLKSENLLVGHEHSDDAAVWKISDDVAIVQTTDFFPPVCSDPYTFGEIAAANSLSDIYAMGAKPITALNLVMFPSDLLPISVLDSILEGGAAKIKESGAVLCGGHSISDSSPKYGLVATGIVHPNEVIRNDQAEVGDILILTKPLGTGTILAGRKLEMVNDQQYAEAIDSMRLLNKSAAEVMQKHKIRSATDITGFGFLGHTLEIAKGSKKYISIDSSIIPVFTGVMDLLKAGCIPGASFKNQEFCQEDVSFAANISYETKMMLFDAQTSGGILMCVPPNKVTNVMEDLLAEGLKSSTIVGEVKLAGQYRVEII